jgi:hypothetical protein
MLALVVVTDCNEHKAARMGEQVRYSATEDRRARQGFSSFVSRLL